MDQTLAHSTSEIMEVWTIDLGANASFVHAAMESLSAQERLRADQCMIPAARTRYILAHAALRRLLAAKLNRDAEEVVFTSGPHGKPELALPRRHPLRFNLSHSGNLALVAISPVAEVGIDVERVRPMPDAVRLAKRFFTPSEAAALCQFPESERHSAFFRLWTRKEALLKATGEGIAHGLERFEVSCDADAGLLSVDGDPTKAKQWTLHDWSPAEGYLAAAALEQPGVRFTRFTIQPFRFAGG